MPTRQDAAQLHQTHTPNITSVNVDDSCVRSMHERGMINISILLEINNRIDTKEERKG